MKHDESIRNLRKALVSPFRNWKTGLTAALLTVLSFISLLLASDPQYSIMTLSFGLHLLDEGIVTLSYNLIRTAESLGLFLTIIYSALIGISIVNFYYRVTAVGLSGFKQLTGILPGYLVAGCAGCGVGLLSFLGFAGATAIIPFSGNLVRIIGITLMLGVLTSIGDPETCAIPSS